MISSIDILGMLANSDLNEVDTSYPILLGGTYEFEVKSAEKKTSEKSGGEYFLFNCALRSEGAADITGAPVAPGYQIRKMINLSPSEKQIEAKGEEQCGKDVIKDVCKFLDALMEERVWDETLETYIGMTFWAKTKVTKERVDKFTGDVYPPAADFASFIPKSEA
jgi:hypothetical protein